MKILAVDSSSITASVALIDGLKVIAEFSINAGLTHSQTLAPMIKAVLNGANITPSEIDLFAVSNGPGSFTGLRIGLATVKAMALVTGKPCVGVSSLYSLAYNFLNQNGAVCACVDARRGGVYNAVFKIEEKKITRLTHDRALDIQDLTFELKNLDIPLQFVGDGAIMCYNSMADNCSNADIFLAPEESRYVKASNVAFAAKSFYDLGTFEDACSLGLNYIRIPQAQRLLEENKLKLQVKKW